MHDLFIRIKGIVRHDGKYLVLKHWIDDRIVDPYVWEFMDCELEKGESPEQAALRALHELAGMDGEIDRPLYTWSQMIGEMQCVGITYLLKSASADPSITLSEEYCGYEWITREQLADYIENQNVLKDILRTIGEETL